MDHLLSDLKRLLECCSGMSYGIVFYEVLTNQPVRFFKLCDRSIDRKADVCILVHCKQFPLKTPYVSVMAYIKSICNRWQHIRAVYYDKTGTKGIDEQIERTGYPNTAGINFTRPTKHGMAMTLKQLMMTPRETDKHLPPREARRRFELPFDKDVQAELNIERWEQTTGTEIYAFSHPQGSKDDRFWSTTLAVYAAITQTEPKGKLVRAF